MFIELGNPKPIHAPDGVTTDLPGPAVTGITLADTKKEDGTYNEGFDPNTSPLDALREFAINKGAVMHWGGNEAIHSVVMTWDIHGAASPSWVAVSPQERDPADAAAFQKFLADFWGAAEGKPEDVEDTHYTQYGTQYCPPGVKPEGV